MSAQSVDEEHFADSLDGSSEINLVCFSIESNSDG